MEAAIQKPITGLPRISYIKLDVDVICTAYIIAFEFSDYGFCVFIFFHQI